MENALPDEELEFRKIKSLGDKYEINENGTILRNAITKAKIKIKLDMHHSNKGYYAGFICFQGKVKRLMIHKLVAECWLGEKPDGMEIDHIDRNSLNNHYTNLRYVNHSEQMKNRVLSDRIINQAKLNCKKWVEEQLSKPVDIITPDGEWLSFPSHAQCSKYMGSVFYLGQESFRHVVLSKHKTEYKGYRIIYLDDKNDIVFIITELNSNQIFVTDQIYIAAQYISQLSKFDFDNVLMKIKCRDKLVGDDFYVTYGKIE